MDLSRVELSDPEGWKVGIGTVPVRTGTFTVESSNGGGGSSGDGGSVGSTPTEKPPAVSEEDEEEKLTEPHSPTLVPAVTSSSLATAPELPAKANPIWVLVLIAVSIITVIIYVAIKHRKE